MKPSVAVGIVHDDFMHSLFVRSLIALLRERPQIAGTIMGPGSCGRLDNSRNEIARRFMETSAKWLLTVDTDMVFTPDKFDKVFETAHPFQAPIVSGAYFVDERPPRICAARTMGEKVRSIDDWPEDEVVDVEYVGAGFMLIHRNVFQKVGESPYRQDILSPSGDLVGEDYSFCTRARLEGFPIKLHTGAFIGHAKTRILGYDT